MIRPYANKTFSVLAAVVQRATSEILPSSLFLLELGSLFCFDNLKGYLENFIY